MRIDIRLSPDGIYGLCSVGYFRDPAGLTYYEVAEFMLSLGVKEAYNLDGGGSSTMYFNGEKINSTAGGERRISDIVYIGY